MLSTLLSSFFEVVLTVITIVVVYQIFLEDMVRGWRVHWQETRGKTSNVEKIAQIKLISDDPVGIENFVTQNAEYLSDQMVKRLVARIESIKAGDVISADDVLKSRLAETKQEEREEDAEATRSERTSH